MIRKPKFWLYLILSGAAVAAESVDAEILKDLDFFTHLEVLQDEVAMDDDASDLVGVDGPESGATK